MNRILSVLPRLPIGDFFDRFIDFLTDYFGWLFSGIENGLGFAIDFFEALIGYLPSLVTIVILGGIAFLASRYNWKIALFTLIGFLLIDSLGLWHNTVQTIALILVATIIALVIGIPVGILAAKNDRLGEQFIRPILDFMQTMPAFVYLIPAVIFFGLGTVPGAVATIIFSMPPVVRLTNHGIRQVPKDVVEAARSVGSTGKQLLVKIQLPIAMPTILQGINQTIMLALSMVVIASMIGAGGLGSPVYGGVQNLNIGLGFEGGLAVVILAMILDRVTQALGQSSSNK